MNLTKRLLALRASFNHLLARYLDTIYQDTVRRRYAAQRSCMEHNPNARLLDVGCQTGINTQRLARAVGTQQMLGLEYNTRTLQSAAQHGIQAILGDANRPLPLPDESVHVVTAMDVIEHLVDPRMLVQEAHRVLRPGGYAVFATPNLASWHNIFALLIGLQPFSGPNLTTMLDADLDVVRRLHRQAYDLAEEGEIEDQGEQELHRHIVVVAFRALVRLMEKEGFHVEVARGFGYYPLPPLLGRLFARLDPWHTHHMVVKGRKK
jgi:2-polyprenyl-3-methyl-5-hydroxy-6-metoxy-1,4-benzoquinol methylase